LTTLPARNADATGYVGAGFSPGVKSVRIEPSCAEPLAQPLACSARARPPICAQSFVFESSRAKVRHCRTMPQARLKHGSSRPGHRPRLGRWRARAFRYDEPYFYVSVYPEPDPAALPRLPTLGHWHLRDFVAAVATADKIVAAKNQQAEIDEFLRAAVDGALKVSS